MVGNQKKYPPFISPRSPSYLRTSSEDPHRADGARALLSQLCVAERDAMAVCTMAAALLEDDEFAEIVRDTGDLHDARRQGLGELLEELGGAPPDPAHSQPVLASAVASVARATTDAQAKHCLDLLDQELDALYEDALHAEALDESLRSTVISFAPSHEQSDQRTLG